MPKISGWSKTVSKTVGEVSPYGSIQEWKHNDTGDTVTIRYSGKNPQPFYYVKLNGNVYTVRKTVKSAREVALQNLRKI